MRNARSRERVGTSKRGRWRWQVDTGEVTWSETLYHVFGLPRDVRPTLEAYLDHVHSDDRARTREVIEQALADRGGFDHHERIVRSDGSVRWLHSRGHACINARGEVEALYGECEDLGPYMAEVPGKAEETTAALAATIAHDLNNVMTVITGSAELMELIPLPGQARPHLSAMHLALGQARDLTSALLSLGRGAERVGATIDTTAAIRRMAPVLRRVVPAATLSLELAEEPLHVHMAPGDLERIVLNLCVNARDAIEDGGVVRVAADGYFQSGQPFVRLTVEDTGRGMDEATLARAFELYFTTKGEHGSGLGLASVKALVRGAGGQIFVESRPGTGTRIELRLPRVR